MFWWIWVFHGSGSVCVGSVLLLEVFVRFRPYFLSFLGFRLGVLLRSAGFWVFLWFSGVAGDSVLPYKEMSNTGSPPDQHFWFQEENPPPPLTASVQVDVCRFDL